MRAKRKGKGIVALLFLLSLLLTGCGGQKSVSDYAERLKREVALPLGVWYSDEAEMWEEGFLDESLCRALFGQADIKAESYRVFLCTEGESICEIALVSMPTRAEAERLSAFLSARLSFLQKTAKENGFDALDDGFVVQRGRCVLYVAAENAAFILSCLSV